MGLAFEVLGQGVFSPPFEITQRAKLNEIPPGGWRVYINGCSARSYAMHAVLADIKMILTMRGVPAPTNFNDLVLEQSSVYMPPARDGTVPAA